jgi:hypothetical protein
MTKLFKLQSGDYLRMRSIFDIAILTRDGNITDSGLVPVVW